MAIALRSAGVLQQACEDDARQLLPGRSYRARRFVAQRRRTALRRTLCTRRLKHCKVDATGVSAALSVFFSAACFNSRLPRLPGAPGPWPSRTRLCRTVQRRHRSLDGPWKPSVKAAP